MPESVKNIFTEEKITLIESSEYYQNILSRYEPIISKYITLTQHVTNIMAVNKSAIEEVPS